MDDNQSSDDTNELRDDLIPEIQQPATETLLFRDIMVDNSLALRNALREFLLTKPYPLFVSEFKLFLNRLVQIGNDNPNVTRGVAQANQTLVRMNTFSTPSNSNASRSLLFDGGPNPFRPIAPDPHYTVVLPNPRYTSTPVSRPRVSIDTSAIQPIVPASVPIAASVAIPDPAPAAAPASAPASTPAAPAAPAADPAPAPATATVQVIENVTADQNPVQAPAPPREPAPPAVETPANQNNDGANQPTGRNTENIKYLRKWRLTIKEIKSRAGASIGSLSLTGVLVSKNSHRVLKMRHSAGILKNRKGKDFIQTNKGLYKLIGPIYGGIPNALFKACEKSEGIPRTWRYLLKKLVEAKEVKRSKENANKKVTRGGNTHKNTAGGNKQTLNRKRAANHVQTVYRTRAAGNIQTLNRTRSGRNNETLKRTRSGRNNETFKRTRTGGYRQYARNVNVQRKPAAVNTKFNGSISPSQYLKLKFHQKYVNTRNLMKKTAENPGRK